MRLHNKLFLTEKLTKNSSEQINEILSVVDARSTEVLPAVSPAPAAPRARRPGGFGVAGGGARAWSGQRGKASLRPGACPPASDPPSSGEWARSCLRGAPPGGSARAGGLVEAWAAPAASAGSLGAASESWASAAGGRRALSGRRAEPGGGSGGLEVEWAGSGGGSGGLGARES